MNTSNKLFDIELLDSGGYIFIKKYWGTHIVKTDSLGNIIWTKEINTETPYATVESIKRLNSNEYIGLVKYVKATSPNYYYGFNIFKININNKQILWDRLYKPYHTIECQTLHEAMGIEIENNGDIIVSGTAYDGDNFGFIFKLNSNGDSLWSKRYSFGPQGDDNCQINDLLVTDNNEFLGVGFYAPNTSSMAAWIFKTDSNGVLNTPKLPEALEGSGITIFPNPANDFVNIEIDKQNLKLSYYKIFDSQGKLVLSNDFVSNRINIKSFSTGIYFIECVGEDGEVARGKFVRN